MGLAWILLPSYAIGCSSSQVSLMSYLPFILKVSNLVFKLIVFRIIKIFISTWAHKWSAMKHFIHNKKTSKHALYKRKHISIASEYNNININIFIFFDNKMEITRIYSLLIFRSTSISSFATNLLSYFKTTHKTHHYQHINKLTNHWFLTPISLFISTKC